MKSAGQKMMDLLLFRAFCSFGGSKGIYVRKLFRHRSRSILRLQRFTYSLVARLRKLLVAIPVYECT